jgi:hypothetical protein
VPGFVAHYLRIDWLDRGVARQVEISTDPIEIEENEDGIYRAETQIFRDFHPWVGLHFSDSEAEVTPCLVGADGQTLSWLRITDTDGRGWWVQDNGWDAEKKIHLSEMHRSFGQFELRLGSVQLFLSNVALDLNRIEAEDYLADFRDELIALAISRKVSASGEVVRSNSRDLVDALSIFSQAARRVLGNPARELTETEELQLSSQLRPNARTFRNILRQPGRRAYPGRGTKDDVNIPDNRFVHHMVQYCMMLSSRIGHAADAQACRLSERMERARAHAQDLSDAKSEKVDSEVFENQLFEMQEAIAAVNNWRNAEMSHDGVVRDFCVKLENSYDYSPRTLFYKKPDANPEDDRKLGITSNIVQLPEAPHLLVKRVSKSLGNYSRIFTFTGTAEIKRSGKNNNMRLLQLNNVDSMIVRSPGLEKKVSLGEYYRKNGWIRILTAVEREERRLEARSIERRGARMAHQAKLSRAASNTLSTTSDDLRAQDLRWSTLGVEASPTLPMGMRFVQSPAYTSVLAAFNRVKDVAGQSGIGGAEIEQIERIGILHASAIYERWCLVRLISLLTDTFDFIPQRDWLDCVIEGTCGPLTSFELGFDRSDVGMTARLEVQPVLESGRRPDFRLTFRHQNAEPNKTAASEIFSSDELNPSTGLILDAKFRTRWRPEEPDRVLQDIVEIRGYKRAARRVFILQPAARVVKRPTSPLSWGHDCDFGQNNPISHRHGIVRMSPDPAAWLNLHRLIALELQASFPVPKQVDNQPWISNSFCIGCGCRHEVTNIRHRLTKKGLDYWIFTCRDCEMITTRTHCFSGCGTTIFKNGLAMTYHRTLADQPANVACPTCGEFFDRDNQDFPNDSDR